jgi:hypothetical protein
MGCRQLLQEYGPVVYCYGTAFNDDIGSDYPEPYPGLFSAHILPLWGFNNIF